MEGITEFQASILEFLCIFDCLWQKAFSAHKQVLIGFSISRKIVNDLFEHFLR